MKFSYGSLRELAAEGDQQQRDEDDLARREEGDDVADLARREHAVEDKQVAHAHGHGRAGAVPRLVPGETRAASMAWGAQC